MVAMFDHFRLKDALVEYKQNFVSKQWGNEKRLLAFLSG